jgi:triosephosphate isomerase
VHISGTPDMRQKIVVGNWKMYTPSERRHKLGKSDTFINHKVRVAWPPASK